MMVSQRSVQGVEARSLIRKLGGGLNRDSLISTIHTILLGAWAVMLTMIATMGVIVDLHIRNSPLGSHLIRALWLLVAAAMCLVAFRNTNRVSVTDDLIAWSNALGLRRRQYLIEKATALTLKRFRHGVVVRIEFDDGTICKFLPNDPRSVQLIQEAAEPGTG